MEKKRGLKFAGAVIAEVLVCSAAQAQAGLPVTSSPTPETPSPAAPTASSALTTARPAPSSIADIVVTARRRSENLQSVPVAVTALTSAALAQHAVHVAEDIQYFTPSLSVQGGSYTRVAQSFSIRGAPPAGTLVYRNEVPLLIDSALNLPTSTPYFDLDSIQVLKGPQGTLFGGSTTGGAVLITTAKPKNDFEGYVQATYGNFNARYLEGAVNIPIVDDKILFRVSGIMRRRDGYTYNIFTNQHVDNQNTNSIRASLTLKPVEGVENTTVYEYNYRQERIGNTVPVLCNPLGSLNGSATTAAPGTWAAQCIANSTLGPRTINQDLTGAGRIRQHFVSNVTTVALSDDLTLKNVFGFTHEAEGNRNDSDGTNFVDTDFGLGETLNPYSKYLYTKQNQISEEIQLQGKSLNDKLTWIAGGFYEKHWEPQYNHLLASVGLPFLFDVVSRVRYSEKAVFGQATYNFDDLIHGLSLTGGVRGTWDKNATISGQNVCNFPSTSPNALQCTGFANAAALFDPTFTGFDATAGSVTTHATSHAVTYNITADYKPIKGLFLYVTKRRGYRPGGVNAFAPIGFNAYKAETTQDWEIGVKSDFRIGDVPVRLDAAAFDDNYANVQRTSSVGPTTTLTVNAQKARLRGVEFQTTIKPMPWLTLDASYARLDDKFRKFVIDFQNFGPIDETSSPFTLAPKTAWSITGTADIPTPENLGKLSLTASYSYRSRTYLALDAYFQPELQQPGYGLVNLQAELDGVGGTGADIILFAKNVTDKIYFDGAGDQTYNYNPFQSTGDDTVFYGEPRTYGVTVRYRFGSH